MPIQPRPEDRSTPALPLDLLVVGGLTVDHFADGAMAPGGSALHATRAAAASGLRVGVVTQAGNEPEAQAALAELTSLGFLASTRSPTSITFRHVEDATSRQLTLLATTAVIACPPQPVTPSAVLYGPVAAELDARLGHQAYAGALTGAILQGWLRALEPEETVVPLPLTALRPALVRELARLDVLVASEEDLSAVAAGAHEQLSSLRRVFGAKPLLVVTGGPRGAWLDAPDVPRQHVDPPRIVSDIRSTGAGDAFAAVLTAHLGQGRPVREAAELASAAAVFYLERRFPA